MYKRQDIGVTGPNKQAFDRQTGVITFTEAYTGDVTVTYCKDVDTEEWQWINIETKPWDYTEFVLPERPDIDDPGPDEDNGDYILVSSLKTADNARVKFVYDAAYRRDNLAKTGLYVNQYDWCVPVRIVDVVYNSPVELLEDVNFDLTVSGDGPFTYAWDFNEDGITDSTVEDPTWSYDQEGTYLVTVDVTNDCYTAHWEGEVVVGRDPYDVDGDGDVDYDDLMEVLRHWGHRDTDPDWDEHKHCDINGDGKVNIVDIMIVLQLIL